MSDCPNAELRDRLPDLLHERLDASVRAMVLRHVESCSDCRVELALLREARIALSSGVPSVDVTSIARVVVERVRMAPSAPRRARQLDWRIAASIIVLVIGGGSLLIVRGLHEESPPAVAPSSVSASAPNVGASTHVAAVPPTPRTPAPVAPATTAELSAVGSVGDLSEGELRTLLNDLDQIDAVPPTEPEPVTVRVSVPSTGSLE
jgi:anti-sigma factor RsiW